MTGTTDKFGPIAVLVACYNRRHVTLPNLGGLIDALAASAVETRVFLLDDASPDETGRYVRDAFPDVTVIDGSGSLFWNGGMRRLFEVAREHGEWAGYLYFNDDVAVDSEAVGRFLALWAELNRERPTTLVGATVALDAPRITYSALRLRSRHRPLALELVEPAASAVEVDTFNGNFVLIPARTLEQIGGNDEAYIHSFGDIDLGLSIRGRGERVCLAPMPIGRCQDRAHGVPSRHGILTRLRQGLSGWSDPRQHIYFIWKHRSSASIAVLVIVAMLTRRVATLVLNRPHVMPGSPHARP